MLNLMFVEIFIKLLTITDGNLSDVFTERQNSQTLWCLAKGHLKQGDQSVPLLFYTEILATLLEY